MLYDLSLSLHHETLSFGDYVGFHIGFTPI